MKYIICFMNVEDERRHGHQEGSTGSLRASSRTGSTICWRTTSSSTRRSSTPRRAARPLRRCISERPPGRFPATLPRRFSLHEASPHRRRRYGRVRDVRRLQYVDGIDIIRCDEAGRSVEFRVMIRPLQAIDAVRKQMRAMLASMQPELHPDER
jgi:hypothetical protein